MLMLIWCFTVYNLCSYILMNWILIATITSWNRPTQTGLKKVVKIAHGVSEFMALESRFKAVKQKNADHYEELVQKAQKQIENRFKLYEQLAKSE